MVIYKYPFQVKDRFEIEMPKEADILTVQNQRETGTMWALCDPNNDKVKRRFAVVGTGHTFDPKEDFQYLGTYQEADGSLVWHVFELI